MNDLNISNNTLEQIQKNFESEIEKVDSLQNLDDLRVKYLGRNGIVTNSMKQLGSLSIEEKKNIGYLLNQIKNNIKILIEKTHEQIREKILQQNILDSKLDLSLPVKFDVGRGIHPITMVTCELMNIFSQYGFEIKDGPDIEDDWYNFTALNMDMDHPARQMHDTFYIDDNIVLRTHTSNVQIRAMKDAKPPFCFIAPGRTYRADSDITHTPMFHQIEGVYVSDSVNMGHLKFVIVDFLKKFFQNPNIEIRFRPSFFPFTEPSAEVDIKMSASSDWLEVLGCGMIHPNVLNNVNISSKEYQGFAFGLGVERLAMLKYGMKDLRQFFDSDIRWLKHYSFSDFEILNLLQF